MPTFIQNYIDKLNISSILEELFSKSVSLVLLFIVFYIVKIILHQVVKRVIKPSLKFSQKDEARQKTISRLIQTQPFPNCSSKNIVSPLPNSFYCTIKEVKFQFSSFLEKLLTTVILLLGTK